MSARPALQNLPRESGEGFEIFALAGAGVATDILAKQTTRERRDLAPVIIVCILNFAF
jgi:hypothetical protein